MIKKDGAFKERRIERSRKRVIEIIKNNLEDSFWTKDKKKFLVELTKNVDKKNIDPFTIAKQLM